MQTIARLTAAAVTAAALTVGGGVLVGAGGQQPAGPPAVDRAGQAGVTPAEIQRMFEAVALVRAQDALKLSDDRYLPFLAKFKALQDVRRRLQQEHVRLIRELSRLTNDANSDEAHLKDRLKALHDLDARSESELHQAYDGIDQVLDVRQQAKFRVFEENMEARRIELVTKARQANRQNRKP